MESMGQIDPVIVWWPCVGTLISVGHDKSYTNTQLERGLRRMPEAWKGVWCCSAPTWPVDYERRLQYLILARMVRGANETAFKPFPAWRRHRYTWGRLGWAFEGNVDRLRRIFPLDRTVAENMAVAPEMNEMSVAVFIYDPGTAPVPPPKLSDMAVCGVSNWEARQDCGRPVRVRPVHRPGGLLRHGAPAGPRRGRLRRVGTGHGRLPGHLRGLEGRDQGIRRADARLQAEPDPDGPEGQLGGAQCKTPVRIFEEAGLRRPPAALCL